MLLTVKLLAELLKISIVLRVKLLKAVTGNY